LKPETINSRWRLLKPDVPVSQLVDKIAKKFQRYLHVFGFEEVNGAIGRLHLETGSQKLKTAAAKPGVPVSLLLYKIAKEFQDKPYVFGVEELNGAIGKDRRRNRV
jgi:hypothetical protein